MVHLRIPKNQDPCLSEMLSGRAGLFWLCLILELF